MPKNIRRRSPCRWVAEPLELRIVPAKAAPEIAVSGLRPTSADEYAAEVIWTRSRSAKGYEVEIRELDSAFQFVSRLDKFTTNLSVPGLEAGEDYELRVSALYRRGMRRSATAVIGTPPDAPGNLHAEVLSASSVQLNWTDAGNETSYRILGGDGSVLATLAANQTSHVLNVSAGVSYTLSVQAQNSLGAKMSGSVHFITAPAAIHGFAATPLSESSAYLTWAPPAGATSYTLFWTTVPTFAWEGIWASPGAGTSVYTLSGLTPGLTYYFRLQASNTGGTSSSDWIAVRTTRDELAIPSIPGGFTAMASSSTTVALNWQDSTGEDGYRVRQWDGAGWPIVANLAAGSTSYSVTGLTANTLYFFKIEAHNAAGVSETGFIQLTTPSGPAALAPAYKGVIQENLRDLDGNEFWLLADGSENITLSSIVVNGSGGVSGLLYIRNFAGRDVNVPFEGDFYPEDRKLYIRNQLGAPGEFYFLMNFELRDGHLVSSNAVGLGEFTVHDLASGMANYHVSNSSSSYIDLRPNPFGT